MTQHRSDVGVALQRRTLSRCRRMDRFCDNRRGLPAMGPGGVQNSCPKSTSHNKPYQRVVRRSRHGTPARLCPRLHHRPATPPPGRRFDRGRLLSGVHRDGKLVFHVFAALAEFERDLIRERTTAGLAAARARDRHGGRPSVMTTHKAQVAQEMYHSGQYTVATIATTLGVSRASIYRHLSVAR
jgi:hypothetical protein